MSGNLVKAEGKKAAKSTSRTVAQTASSSRKQTSNPINPKSRKEPGGAEPQTHAKGAAGILESKSARSESSRTEEKFRKYQDYLERLVKKLTYELEFSQDKLAHLEKLSELGKLTATIAHEFNNPIFGIRNILDQTRENDCIDEEQKYLLGLGVEECDRMTDLVGKLQDFGRPSPGLPVPVDIHKALDDIVLLTRRKLQKRKIKLKKCFAADMPKIIAVEDQVKQVWLNLIQNAEEAIPDEGGVITISTEIAGSTVKIHFRDTGPGISADIMQWVFDPFFTTKSALKGVGLGLSVSYEIVSRHGGEVDITSAPGKGATFTVVLPIEGR